MSQTLLDASLRRIINGEQQLGLSADEQAQCLREEATAGNLTRLGWLIEAGVDVNRAGFGHHHERESDEDDDPGWTALVLASKHGHETCTLALLNAGTEQSIVQDAADWADDVVRDEGVAEEMLASSGWATIVELRENCRRCANLLWKALLPGLDSEKRAGLFRDAVGSIYNSGEPSSDVDRMRMLIEAGVGVNDDVHPIISSRQNFVTSALHEGSQYGTDACVCLLIDEGAEIDKADSKGNTALMLACCSGREAIALILLNAGAKSLLDNDKGATAAQLLDAQQRTLEERARGEGGRGAGGRGRGGGRGMPRAAMKDAADRLERNRSCIQLLQQLRRPVEWSPATHAEFPKYLRTSAAELSWPLLPMGLWIATRSPKVPHTGSAAMRDVWLEYVQRQVCEAIPPLSRVVS